MTFSRLVAGIFLFSLVGPSTFAADQPNTPPARVSYAREVLPILQQHCLGCHQPAKAQGSYIMTSRAEMLKKGDSDKTNLVPGKPQESNLLAEITPQGGKPPAMPKNRAPLSDKEVALIRGWIA